MFKKVMFMKAYYEDFVDVCLLIALVAIALVSLGMFLYYG